jgi:hypothetical protein
MVGMVEVDSLLTDVELDVTKAFVRRFYGDAFVLASERGRNLLVVRVFEQDERVYTSIAWGLLHETLDRACYEPTIDGTVAMKVDGCVSSVLISCLTKLAGHKVVLDRKMDLVSNVAYLRTFLTKLDFILVEFEKMLENMNIRLGSHITCDGMDILFENGIVYHNLYFGVGENGHCYYGDIGVHRAGKGLDIGVGFEYDFKGYIKYWFGAWGIREKMMPYMQSMAVEGDV